ncbi:MAG: hypothetical protein U0836_05075 [Pirellulales bacterium]
MRGLPLLARWTVAAIMVAGFGPSPLLAQSPGGGGSPAGGGGGAVGASSSTDSAGPTAGLRPARVEGWRFRWHDDLWWYYTPARTWVVWQGSRWTPYQRGALYARGGPALVSQLPASSAVPVTAGYRPDYLGVGMYSQAGAAPASNASGR